ENPNNWGWDGTYHGLAKWYYATPQYSNTYDQCNDTQAPAAGGRTFDLVVDGKSMLLSVQNQWCNALYGLFEFYDAEIRGANALLAATGLNFNPTQAQNRYAAARGGLMTGFNNSVGPGGAASQAQAGLLWYNNSALRQDQKISRPIALGFMT